MTQEELATMKQEIKLAKLELLLKKLVKLQNQYTVPGTAAASRSTIANDRDTTITEINSILSKNVDSTLLKDADKTLKSMSWDDCVILCNLLAHENLQAPAPQDATEVEPDDDTAGSAAAAGVENDGEAASIAIPITASKKHSLLAELLNKCPRFREKFLSHPEVACHILDNDEFENIITHVPLELEILNGYITEFEKNAALGGKRTALITVLKNHRQTPKFISLLQLVHLEDLHPLLKLLSHQTFRETETGPEKSLLIALLESDEHIRSNLGCDVKFLFEILSVEEYKRYLELIPIDTLFLSHLKEAFFLSDPKKRKLYVNPIVAHIFQNRQKPSVQSLLKNQPTEEIQTLLHYLGITNVNNTEASPSMLRELMNEYPSLNLQKHFFKSPELVVRCSRNQADFSLYSRCIPDGEDWISILCQLDKAYQEKTTETGKASVQECILIAINKITLYGGRSKLISTLFKNKEFEKLKILTSWLNEFKNSRDEKSSLLAWLESDVTFQELLHRNPQHTLQFFDDAEQFKLFLDISPDNPKPLLNYLTAIHAIQNEVKRNNFAKIILDYIISNRNKPWVSTLLKKSRIQDLTLLFTYLGKRQFKNSDNSELYEILTTDKQSLLNPFLGNPELMVRCSYNEHEFFKYLQKLPCNTYIIDILAEIEKTGSLDVDTKRTYITTLISYITSNENKNALRVLLEREPIQRADRLLYWLGKTPNEAQDHSLAYELIQASTPLQTRIQQNPRVVMHCALNEADLNFYLSLLSLDSILDIFSRVNQLYETIKNDPLQENIFQENIKALVSHIHGHQDREKGLRGLFNNKNIKALSPLLFWLGKTQNPDTGNSYLYDLLGSDPVIKTRFCSNSDLAIAYLEKDSEFQALIPELKITRSSRAAFSERCNAYMAAELDEPAEKSWKRQALLFLSHTKTHDEALKDLKGQLGKRTIEPRYENLLHELLSTDAPFRKQFFSLSQKQAKLFEHLVLTAKSPKLIEILNEETENAAEQRVELLKILFSEYYTENNTVSAEQCLNTLSATLSKNLDASQRAKLFSEKLVPLYKIHTKNNYKTLSRLMLYFIPIRIEHACLNHADLNDAIHNIFPHLQSEEQILFITTMNYLECKLFGDNSVNNMGSQDNFKAALSQDNICLVINTAYAQKNTFNKEQFSVFIKMVAQDDKQHFDDVINRIAHGDENIEKLLFIFEHLEQTERVRYSQNFYPIIEQINQPAVFYKKLLNQHFKGAQFETHRLTQMKKLSLNMILDLLSEAGTPNLSEILTDNEITSLLHLFATQAMDADIDVSVLSTVLHFVLDSGANSRISSLLELDKKIRLVQWINRSNASPAKKVAYMSQLFPHYKTMPNNELWSIIPHLDEAVLIEMFKPLGLARIRHFISPNLSLPMKRAIIASIAAINPTFIEHFASLGFHAQTKASDIDACIDVFSSEQLYDLLLSADNAKDISINSIDHVLKTFYKTDNEELKKKLENLSQALELDPSILNYVAELAPESVLSLYQLFLLGKTDKDISLDSKKAVYKKLIAWGADITENEFPYFGIDLTKAHTIMEYRDALTAPHLNDIIHNENFDNYPINDRHVLVSQLIAMDNTFEFTSKLGETLASLKERDNSDARKMALLNQIAEKHIDLNIKKTFFDTLINNVGTNSLLYNSVITDAFTTPTLFAVLPIEAKRHAITKGIGQFSTQNAQLDFLVQIKRPLQDYIGKKKDYSVLSFMYTKTRDAKALECEVLLKRIDEKYETYLSERRDILTDGTIDTNALEAQDVRFKQELADMLSTPEVKRIFNDPRGTFRQFFAKHAPTLVIGKTASEQALEETLVQVQKASLRI